jgi:membrane protein DedA with SNARE-associated domain
MTDVIPQLIGYGYWFLFPAVLIEGPLVTFLAGWLIGLGVFHFWGALAVIVAADLVGDVFLYGVGRWGLRRLLPAQTATEKPNKRIARLQRFFTEHPNRALLAGKFSHGIGGPILIAAGTAKVAPVRFLIITTLATIIKTAGLLWLGLALGGQSLPVANYFRYIALFSLLLVLAWGWWYDRRIMAGE